MRHVGQNWQPGQYSDWGNKSCLIWQGRYHRWHNLSHHWKPAWLNPRWWCCHYWLRVSIYRHPVLYPDWWDVPDTFLVLHRPLSRLILSHYSVLSSFFEYCVVPIPDGWWYLPRKTLHCLWTLWWQADYRLSGLLLLVIVYEPGHVHSVLLLFSVLRPMNGQTDRPAHTGIP